MKVRACPNCKYYNSANAWSCARCHTTLSENTLKDVSESDYYQHSKSEDDQPNDNGSESLKSVFKITQFEEQLINSARNLRSAVLEIDKKYISEVQQAKQQYKQIISSIQHQIVEITNGLGRYAAPWSSPIWEDSVISSEVPIGIRFGDVIFKGQFGQFEAPAIVPILNQGNLMFISRGQCKKIAIQALQSSLLRVVATFPPGKVKLTLIDPVGLGANVAGFMNLPEQIIGVKAWTEPRDIEQQLTDLSAHMENVIQKYLRNEYKSMEDYNRYAGEIAEPYRFLGIINFPANFTDVAAKRLISIASNGPTAGVYVICTIDADLPLPYGFNLPDLVRTGSAIESNETGDFIWRVPELDKLGLRLDRPPAAENFNRIVLPVGKAAKEGDLVEVSFEKISLPELDWWQANTINGIKVPLGRKGARDIQYLEFGYGTQHYGLMAGKPGSGKSTLLHVLITNLAMQYPPEELMLYLVDFKKGVEFKDYAVYKLPHARVIGIESEREFGLSVLKEVQQEMNRRGDLFRQANIRDFSIYRTKTKDKLPRVFLIVDEFQRLFSEDDPLADQAANILAHIVQQGRAFGIHVLLASQTLADAYAVGRATYDKMSVRIALQCSEADSRLILGEDNAAARLLTRPGEGVYNALNGREEGNNFFQVAWLPDDKREHYLKRIVALAVKNTHQSPYQQVIFEGHIPSRISSNIELWNALRANQWPNSSSVIKIFLGESTEISPPHTVTHIRPQGRSNIMILGQSERTAFSLLSTIWLSLLAYTRPEGAQYYVIDFSRADDPWASLLHKMRSLASHPILFARPRDFIEALMKVNQIVDKRMQSGVSGDRKVFLLIAGLHRARELREMDQYGSPGEISQIFGNICREGPDLGVHVITWCDTYGSLTRLLSRNSISEFDIRVAMQMGEDDSNQFIESPKAKSLGQNRAYLYDMTQLGTLEKFRPYELISDDELIEIQTFFERKS